MSEDPFTALNKASQQLKKALQSALNFEPVRNGVYTNTQIQELSNSLDAYDPSNKKTFIILLNALVQSLPYLEKWHVDFKNIRSSIDSMAKKHDLPSIEWEKILNHPKISHKFFSSQNLIANLELLPWISFQVGRPYSQLNPTQAAQALIKHLDFHGFSQKVTAHLARDPNFLFNLMMDNESNFIDIVKTRLTLFISDQQIALAIIKHCDKLVDPHPKPLIEVEHFIEKLNGILSIGRSVNALLRNSEAKSILDTSVYFQTYQSEAYEHRNDPHSSRIEPR